MKFNVKITSQASEEKGNLLVCGIYQENEKNPSRCFDNLNSSMKSFITGIISRGDFKGIVGNSLIIYPKGEIGFDKLLLVGMGKKEELNAEKIRQVASVSLKAVKRINLKSFSTLLFGIERNDLQLSNIVEAMIEGFELTDYRFTDFITEKKDEIKKIDEITLIHDEKEDEIRSAVKMGKIMADATVLARNMGNWPANIGTPTKIASVAEELARTHDQLECEVFSQPELEQMNFGSFLSVARGSNEPCKFIVIKYEPSSSAKQTIVLIGKGITFDSGGISLKTPNKMWEMKMDMSGAAAVIGAIKGVSELQLPLRVIGLIPATENLPGGISPNKPGDIITSLSGKTIEIINTDAEGRLILVDAITHAVKYKPDIVIDIATLTGACMVALGSFASGIFSDDDELVAELVEAGKQIHERLWRLPVWEEYEKGMESEIADVKNLGERMGGASYAAAFLKHFTTKDYRWAHVDIAPTMLSEKESHYVPKGATGVGVRLFLQFLRNRSKIEE
ncbi:MAG: leucyl aminopeptidase [Candidatus Helarchaeota archaeon]